MSIELKQLQHYLDGSLQGKYNLHDVDDRYPNEERFKVLTEDNVAFFRSWCKSIMFPLSALTEPVLEGGKIPIVELMKIGIEPFLQLSKQKTEIQAECYFIDGEDPCCSFVKNHLQIEFTYSIKMQVFTHKLWNNKSANEDIYPAMYQLELFNKLYEWHFWLFQQDLFETGELIDKRTTL